MKIRVYYEDTDAGGIVYHANYLKFCERARSEMLFNACVDAFNDGANFVVSSVNAKFLRSAKLGDTLLVKNEIVKLKQASIILKQEIFRTATLKSSDLDELLFTAEFVLAFLSNSKPAKITKEIALFFNK